MLEVATKRNAQTSRRFLVVCLLFLLLPNVFCYGQKSDDETLDEFFPELGMTLENGSAFILTRNVPRQGSKGTLWTIEAHRGDCVLKIEMIGGKDEESAASHIEERKLLIETLFESVPSPYPGIISHTIAVSSESALKVVTARVQGQTEEIYLLPSNDRFTYGPLEEDLIRYRGGVMFHYERDGQSLYRIDLFVPRETYEEGEVLALFASMRFSGRVTPPRSRDRAASTEDSITEPAEDQFQHDRTVVLKDASYNLIILAFEPLGARHVSGYGYPKTTTPNLDRVSSDAVLFTNAISASSWTLPAFMSCFTSLYPSQHRLTNKYRLETFKNQESPDLSSLPDSVVTLAQVLKGEGFNTCGFTGGAALSGHFGYRKGFDDYFDDGTFGGFDVTMPRAVEWLRQNQDSRFFLFVQGYDVHGRYALRKEAARDIFLEKPYEGRFTGSVEEYWELRKKALDVGSVSLTQKDAEFWRADYDAKIFLADELFGAFVEELRALDLLEKTVFVITSGSGNEYLEHGRIDHGLTLYDELVMVPLVIRMPNAGAKRVEQQVRTVDIMPTVMDLLDIDASDEVVKQMRGRSLVPLMTGHDMTLDAFSETDYLAQSFKRSVRTADGWKFIYSLDTENKELYDLNTDPRETRNLVDEEHNIAVVLENRLFNHLASLKAYD